MPIGDFEGEILRLLARNRNPDSFVAGASVLLQHSDTVRESQDVDVFHDTTESLERCSNADIATLVGAGYEVEALPGQETFRRAIIRRGGKISKVEWVFDSAFRFFPIEPDPDFGYRLNFWDAATNKVLAMVGRREIRDYLDVVYLQQHHLPLGALAWAAAGKDPGLSPEYILNWANRLTKYRNEELVGLRLSQPVDLQALKHVWLSAVHDAQSLIERMPPSEMGCFYLDARGQPVCPDPDSAEFSTLTRHFGSVKGAWPRVVQE